MCFCHLIEWQANMFFLFVFMSFSRIEPRLFKQQYFLKFDFYDIMKPIFSRSKFFFCVFASQENGRKFFFVCFFAFIKMLMRFSDINPIQDWGGGGLGKKAPYQFFLCNFYKRRVWSLKLSDF